MRGKRKEEQKPAGEEASPRPSPKREGGTGAIRTQAQGRGGKKGGNKNGPASQLVHLVFPGLSLVWKKTLINLPNNYLIYTILILLNFPKKDF